jgi:ABC-type uncharacterized transport system substrate-binding protein
MSAFGGKADIDRTCADVCFDPKRTLAVRICRDAQCGPQRGRVRPSAHNEEIPSIISNAIRRNVSAIATPASSPASVAAKAATTTIPIIFAVGEDPVALGLVASLARPGGNATGFNFFANEIDAKRLALMHELLPKAKRFAVLINPDVPASKVTSEALKRAAGDLSLELIFFSASTAAEIDAAFTAIDAQKFDALFVAPDAFFGGQGSKKLATLAARDRIPATAFASDFGESRTADELRNKYC